MICKLRPFIRVLFHFVDGFLCCIDAFWYYFTSASAVHELTISRCITWVSKRKRNQRLNCQHFVGSWRKQGSSRKTSTSASLTTLKPLTVFSSVQSLKLCLTLCDPMNCSTPGFPVHHQGPELAHTHVYQVGDAIQPSHFFGCVDLTVGITTNCGKF